MSKGNVKVANVDVNSLKHTVYSQSADVNIKQKESSILQLSGLLAKQSKSHELASLIKYIQPLLIQVSNAKAAKLIRCLIDDLLSIEDKSGKQVQVCLDCIQWTIKENRVFLRNSLQCKLVKLYLDLKEFDKGAVLGEELMTQLKKLDDKALLVQVQLSLSKIYYFLGNYLKARGALTSGRTTANGIYCPPRLQAALDMQSGILHSTEENDFKTAYSYFFEAFEAYDSVKDQMAIKCLKYMMMTRIMSGTCTDVKNMMTANLKVSYSGRDVDAMKEIALAAENRSLSHFNSILENFKEIFENDSVIKFHLNILYTHMVEQNLIKIVEPFSFVEISHIAKLMLLPVEVVEKHLSKMILDKKLNGIIDQSNDTLELTDEEKEDTLYENTLTIISKLNDVVECLIVKANKLT